LIGAHVEIELAKLELGKQEAVVMIRFRPASFVAAGLAAVAFMVVTAGAGPIGEIPEGPGGGVEPGPDPFGPGGIPTGGIPTGGIPTGGLPIGGIPTGDLPIGGAPTGGDPTGGDSSSGETASQPLDSAAATASAVRAAETFVASFPTALKANR
jgi:hypothetical protein